MAARQRRYSKEDRVNEGKYSITPALLFDFHANLEN